MAPRAPAETLDHRAPFMSPDRIGRLEVSERSDRASRRLGLVRPGQKGGSWKRSTYLWMTMLPLEIAWVGEAEKSSEPPSLLSKTIAPVAVFQILIRKPSALPP